MSTALKIDGRAFAEDVLVEVHKDVLRLRAEGVLPCLAVVLVGDDPASDIYVRNKVRSAHEVGIRSVEYRLKATTSSDELLSLIVSLNNDSEVHGILVQMPLPEHLDANAVINTIDPRKDVDGFHRDNVGNLTLGRSSLAPCTPTGCLYLLQKTRGKLDGLHAVVIGRSNIVGRPMASLLLNANCSVTILHSRSKDAAAICRTADIVVAAVGKPHFIDSSWIKPGAVVIDVGINRVVEGGKARVVGDANYDDVSRVAEAITPVPGGVGPMTIAFLMSNTVTAARNLTQSVSA
ncbi:bifunctional methylenetetrahydrofolate dehydrogenase/methenyltetrahydrofolate cyclohydrolase FolD [Burkholderia contaminans]|uniref:bifunctional methylenetetrahydrofolate dehydrogenase/methenyltetrahydrofolate cyclohydrolase FolD n=1 Tax=Burkholderia contaminans TaxID=488447 RepID=UPI0006186A33|nr:bifunctional methylenetetrahydrofolate dehydrogenase/methenyltetrahydrofolate cyclohydrolase FolD [Burkholderia contaminans]GLZ73514.1 bifunctional protein FolD 2 [Burkholderia contaminans]